MWIASRYGWFSIAYKFGSYNVRARTQTDIDNLLEATDLDVEAWYIEKADYQWRATLDADQLVKVMATLAASVDYENFKSEIHRIPDQKDKSKAYMTVWSTMLDWGDTANGYRDKEEDKLPPLQEDLGLFGEQTGWDAGEIKDAPEKDADLPD